jgi:hypothetical protein
MTGFSPHSRAGSYAAAQQFNSLDMHFLRPVEATSPLVGLTSNELAMKNAKAILEGLPFHAGKPGFGSLSLGGHTVTPGDLGALVRSPSFDSILAELPRSLSDVCLADLVPAMGQHQAAMATATAGGEPCNDNS